MAILDVYEFHSSFRRTRKWKKKNPCSDDKGADFMLEAVITAKLLQLTKKQLHATQSHLSYQAPRIPFS